MYTSTSKCMQAVVCILAYDVNNEGNFEMINTQTNSALRIYKIENMHANFKQMYASTTENEEHLQRLTTQKKNTHNFIARFSKSRVCPKCAFVKKQNQTSFF